MLNWIRTHQRRASALALCVTAGLLSIPAPHTLALDFAALAGVIALYFLPCIVAEQRKAPSRGSVFTVNFFLGWTCIGWIVAMAMASRDPAPLPSPPRPDANGWYMPDAPDRPAPARPYRGDAA